MSREVEDLRAILHESGGSAFVFGSSSGAALAMQGVAAGLPIRKLALYEPPLGEPRPGGPSLPEARHQMEGLVAADDRAGAVRYFLTAMLGAPRPFVAMMPVIMRSTWAKTTSVANTLPYDLAIIADRTVLSERAGKVSVPTLVVGGGKSPPYMQRAVERVTNALPNARALVLPGESHDVSAAAGALTPVLIRFFSSDAAERAVPASGTGS